MAPRLPLLAAGVLLTAAGSAALLPSETVIERQAVVYAPPAQVYALLSSNAGFQRFNPYKDADPELEITLFGPERGVGSGFAFDGKDGTGTQTISKVQDGQYVAMDIDLGSMGHPFQEFELSAVDGGTQVTWRVTLDAGKNPGKRLFGVFAEGMLAPTYERGLELLDSTLTGA
jgi:uncharacterized protein YndB with AHSA1/START domain